LFIACEKGKAGCAKLLVEAGANVSKSTFLIKTPLYIACEMGQVAIVQILLKYSTRSDVVMETNYGTTAAFIAQR
jgi:ankyrin repeat protein